MLMYHVHVHEGMLGRIKNLLSKQYDQRGKGRCNESSEKEQADEVRCGKPVSSYAWLEEVI